MEGRQERMGRNLRLIRNRNQKMRGLKIPSVEGVPRGRSVWEKPREHADPLLRNPEVGKKLEAWPHTSGGVKHGTELSYSNTQYLSNKREPRRDDKKKKLNLAAACGI